MSLYSGDDTGLVKRVDLAPRFNGGGVTARWGEQAAGAGVDSVCYFESHNCVGAGLGNGAVRFWRTEGDAAGEVVADFSAHAGKNIGTAGLRAVGGTAPRAIAVDKRGCVRVWRWPEAGTEEAAPAASFEIGRDVQTACIDPTGSRVAAGGRESDAVIWDVNACAVAFQARNVPHDNLDLAVPVWISGLSFLTDKPQQFVASTGFVDQRLQGEVRLYDASAQRRPVMRKIAPLGEEALTALTCAPDGRTVLAGSCSGSMARLDLRMNLKVLGRFKGAAGSIRELSVHPTLPLLASASLDRHVRIYRLEGNGSPLCKLYLKQRVSAVVFAPGVPAGTVAEDDIDAMLDALPDADGDGGTQEGGGGEGEEGGAEESSDDGDDPDADPDASQPAKDGAAFKVSVNSTKHLDEDGDEGGEDEDEEEEEEEEKPPPRRASAAGTARASKLADGKANRRSGASVPATDKGGAATATTPSKKGALKAAKRKRPN